MLVVSCQIAPIFHVRYDPPSFPRTFALIKFAFEQAVVLVESLNQVGGEQT